MTTAPVTSKARRHLLVPEVIQTSAMDCGPAALKCLLEGFGISVSYGRLREACQTDVDGTSVDTIEEVAVQLGLEAEQVMVPVDHVLLATAQALPALVVVRQPNGVTHFVIVWRRHGRFVQVMDPATGRRWSTCQQLLNELYIHTTPVPSDAWREWAGSEEFLNPLCQRLADLGLTRLARQQIVDAALKDQSWHSLAALDATTRMLNSIVSAGGLRRGQQANRVLEAFLKCTRIETAAAQTVPSAYWSVQSGPLGEEGEQLLLKGAILVRVRGRRPVTQSSPTGELSDAAGEVTPLSPELVAALEEPPSRPGHELLRLLRADGLLTPTALVTALLLAAGGVIFEALLFRGFIDISQDLSLVTQRLGAVSALLVFVTALLIVDFSAETGVLRIGRHLETRLRLAFLEKIPRLGDRYFQSRLTSDMAERSHSTHQLRLLPELGGQLLRVSFELVLTTVGIAWLAPASAPIALLTAMLAVGLPLIAQPLLVERDLRVRIHSGALSRFYLDALLGLIAVWAHAAERAVRREHESLLVEWTRAGLGLQRAVVTIEGMQSFAGFGLAAWLLLGHLLHGGEVGSVLLLVYWALNLPVLGQEIALIARQYPAQRNTTLRLLEPLGALEESDVGKEKSDCSKEPAQGASIVLEGVSVKASGHTILEEIDLVIAAGSHVAIIDPSGAGKSSLVGLLLGWHRPLTGQVLVDGEPLAGRHLERLRRETAWVDPAVQLWNRSLLDNVYYGGPSTLSLSLGRVLEAANLYGLLKKLPDGLQTILGEGGALVSGGEGQRVRLGRAMLRPGVRLAILDEPFRGLERLQRRELLASARKLWSDATLLCITHDVGETLAFERVLVIEAGRIIEDGAPNVLAQQAGSRYRTLLEAEDAVRQGIWSNGDWRRLWLREGRLVEGNRSAETW